MAAKKKEAAPVAATIPPVLTKKFKVKIQAMDGSSLVMHRWDRKQRDEILMKQMGIPMGKKAPKNPIADFIGSMYWLTEQPAPPPIVVPEEGFQSMDDLICVPKSLEKILAKSKFGVPAAAFRKGMISAARYVEGLTMVFIRGAFFIVGDQENGDIVSIKSDPPIMREDAVTIGMNGTDFRYRGEFQNWSAELTIAYDPTLIKPPQLINLLNRAGFSVGLLEGRPEKGGQWGRYEVLKSGAARAKAS